MFEIIPEFWEKLRYAIINGELIKLIDENANIQNS